MSCSGAATALADKAQLYVICCKFNLISIWIIDIYGMCNIMILNLILDLTMLEISSRFLKVRAANPECEMLHHNCMARDGR